MARNTLYDTRSYVRMRVDLKQGVGFGLIALALSAATLLVSRPEQRLVLHVMSSLVLYFGMMSLPFRAQLLTLLLWSAALALPSTTSLFGLRTFVFGALVLVSTKSRFGLFPFFTILAAWIGFAAAHLPTFQQYLPPLGMFRQTLTHELVRAAVLECFGILILHFFLWSNRFSRFLHKTQRPVDTRSILTAISLIGILTSIVVVTQVLMAMSGFSMQSLANGVSRHPHLAIIALVAVFAMPLIIGSALNRLIADFIAQLHELSDPNKRLFQPGRGIPTIAEFKGVLHQLRSIIDSVLSQQKEALFRVKVTQEAMDLAEREIRSREQDAQNLERLMSAAPLGYLAVSGSGAILAVNERFFNLTSIPSGKYIGEHFSTLPGDSAWRHEVLDAISAIVRDTVPLFERGSLKAHTSLKAHRYLEIECYPATVSGLDLAQFKNVQHLSISDIAVIVLVREVGDLRDFYLSRIAPTTITMLGAHAIEHCKQLRADAQVLHQTYQQASRDIAQVLQDPRMNRYADSLLFLREAEQFAQRACSQLESFANDAFTKTSPCKKFDLATSLRFGIEQILELIGLDETIPLDFDDGLISEGSPEYLIEAPEPEFYALLSSLLAVIHALMPRTAQLALHVGRESIGANTATFIPNSAPGQYARIILQHPGQSITANMVPTNIRMVDPTIDAPGGLEAPLAILSLHVQRLKGFLSLVSSATKGTTITIYIPEAPHLVERRPREFERHAERVHIQPTSTPPLSAEPLALTSNEARGHVFLLSELFDMATRLDGLLQTLNIQVTKCGPDAPSTATELFEFGGAGFASENDRISDTSASAEVSIEYAIPSNIAEFDLAILAGDSSAQLFKKLKEIRAVSDRIPVIVFGIDAPEDDEIPGAYFFSPPIEDEVVKRAVKRVLKQSSQNRTEE